MRRKPEFITVVVPVRNGERHLADQLVALAGQTYAGPWELVIVDNGSTDRTLETVHAGAQGLPSLRLVSAGEHPGLNHARQVGAAAARGDFLAFCDADDVVDPRWLAEMAAAAPDADIVGGVRDHHRLNGSIPRDWVPPDDALPLKHAFLPAVSGGNCGMWTSVARELGWNETYAYGSSDIEFSWRAQLAGYRLVSAPHAVLHERRRPSLLGLARQWYAYGRSGPQLYREFRSAGMPRAEPRRALRTLGWLLLTLPRVLRNGRFRGHWVRISARMLGSAVGSLRHRVLFVEAPARPPQASRVSRRRTASIVLVQNPLGDDGGLGDEILARLRRRGWDAHVLDPKVNGSVSPSLVHFQSLRCGPTAIRSAHAAGSKVIVSADGDDLAYGSASTPWDQIDVLQLPESGLWALAQRLGCAPDQVIAPIPPLADPSFSELFGRRPRWSGDGVGLRVLSGGPLRWYGGYEYALEAVRLLLDRGVACSYRIVGDGPYSGAVAFARDQLALSACTEIVPAADPETLRAHMAWADVYLSPGLVDGESSMLVQAQAVGLPLVATSRRGEPRDLIPKEAGFVVPRRDPGALAEKLELLRGDAVRQRLGEAARAVALERFGMEDHVARLDELYRRTLAET